ncbi:putative regulator of chromosome condensation 1/beta-lactamase-inhibitor protein II [Helianthus annuus]|nr:putative regulator of chromosome condensation 1/beta-lactamase-inhibitor protein II [Helianthus annuus]KAJ0502019.1 putative regulator of chromosome condensation 1/beta-lactamase-inhibitor protein II [Helianthus annuus]KAJ0509972.1 putative regulator of chromosome condensation 1/beta-lactamase-inhibitor protein II [Helianthus annuus]KAJ0517943.1 putative regulator of chromosome condensation 1/beta-lactamase-inhibitor protein II [Helianthus annuus]KAJ0644280.1 putative regulator of chromosome
MVSLFLLGGINTASLVQAQQKRVACGADFTVWLTSDEELLDFHSMVNLDMDLTWSIILKIALLPAAISSFADETIVNMACGSNHTVAVEWGFGGYGRLGNREQKDKFTPRRVDVFTKHNVLRPGAVVSAGSANSTVTGGAGQMYMRGKIKNTGDDLMYPKPLLDLSVACGFAHSLVVVDRTNAGDQLDLLEIYDGEGVEEPRAELSPAKQTKKMSCCCKNIQQEEEIQRSF